MTAAPFLLQRALKRQEAGMREKHQREATHQWVVQRVGELVGCAGVLQLAKSGGQEFNNRFYRQTLERTHAPRLAKRKNSGDSPAISQPFRLSRELLVGRDSPYGPGDHHAACSLTERKRKVCAFHRGSREEKA